MSQPFAALCEPPRAVSTLKPSPAGKRSQLQELIWRVVPVRRNQCEEQIVGNSLRSQASRQQRMTNRTALRNLVEVWMREEVPYALQGLAKVKCGVLCVLFEETTHLPVPM
jgi:hypothetical protein